MSGLEIFLIVFASLFFVYEIVSLVIQILKRVKEEKEKSLKGEQVEDDDSN